MNQPAHSGDDQQHDHGKLVYLQSKVGLKSPGGNPGEVCFDPRNLIWRKRKKFAHGFERLGLHRISLEVYAFNPRARRAYEKVGFRVEGVLRDSFRYNGEWIDATVMSILASEWGR